MQEGNGIRPERRNLSRIAIPPPRKRRGSPCYVFMKRLMLGFLVCVLLLIALGVSWFGQEMYAQITLGSTVQSRYGFTIGSPFVQAGPSRIEVMTIASVVPGGLFSKAGFKAEDIVVEPGTIGQLYRLLNSPSGTQVTVGVVEGGNGAPIEQRVRRDVRLIAP